MSTKSKTRPRTATAQAGSVQRMVLLRLLAGWRQEAKIFRRELGACIAEADRAQVTASYRKLEYCAGELERVAQQNGKSSDTPRQ